MEELVLELTDVKQQIQRLIFNKHPIPEDEELEELWQREAEIENALTSQGVIL